jgi:hypothetical protein
MKNRVRIPGILGGILFAVGIVGSFTIPGGGDVTDQQFITFYESSGKRTMAVFGSIVLVIACWLLVWLFRELRASLAPGARAEVGNQLGIAGAVMVIVGGGIKLAPTMVQMDSVRAFVGQVIANVLEQAGAGVMMAGIWTMAVSIFLTSLHMRSSGTPPRWLGLFGMVISVLLAASFIGEAILLLPIWAIVVGITGVRAEEHN